MGPAGHFGQKTKPFLDLDDFGNVASFETGLDGLAGNLPLCELIKSFIYFK